MPDDILTYHRIDEYGHEVVFRREPGGYWGQVSSSLRSGPHRDRDGDLFFQLGESKRRYYVSNTTEAGLQDLFLKDKIDIYEYSEGINWLLEHHPERLINHQPPPRPGLRFGALLFATQFSGVLIALFGVMVAVQPVLFVLGVMLIAMPTLMGR